MGKPPVLLISIDSRLIKFMTGRISLLIVVGFGRGVRG